MGCIFYLSNSISLHPKIYRSYESYINRSTVSVKTCITNTSLWTIFRVFSFYMDVSVSRVHHSLDDDSSKRILRKRQKLLVASKAHKEENKLSRFDFLLYGMVAGCTSAAFAIALTPILSSDTAAHLIFNTIFPKEFTNHLTASFICFIYLTVFGYLGIIPVL